MPRVTLEVPDHTPGEGLSAEWDDGFQINVRVENGEVILQGNNAGFRSLARLLLGLTVDGVQDWHHWHLEEWNCLEEGSAPMTIMKLRESNATP